MEDKPNVEQLKSQIQEEIRKGNYNLIIELADKILKEEPEDFITLNNKFNAYFSLKQGAPESEKEGLSKGYLEFLYHLVNFMENRYNFNDDKDKDKITLYQNAQNNIAWEMNLYGKTKEDWERGLVHVQKSLDFSKKEYILDTKLRLLLKLGRNGEAFDIALSMLKKDEYSKDFQDIKIRADFKEWVKQERPNDLIIIDKYAGIKAEEKVFLQEIESINQRPVPRLDKEEDDKFGFFVENESMVYLNLSNIYNLESIPESLGNLKSLRRLDIRWCSRLKSIPESVGNLKNLVELNISGCYDLESLPKGLGGLESLERLELNQCDELMNLPEGITNLNKLVSLKLENVRNLKSLPKNIGKLNSLTELAIIRAEKLKDIPESVCDLINLVNMRLEKCKKIKSLPNHINKLENLTELTIKGISQLISLPITLVALNKLKKLVIDNCGELKSLPDNINVLNQLEELAIKNLPKLLNLPKTLWLLKNIKKLSIEYCKELQISPVNILELHSLQELTLKNCKLTQLPDILSSMKSVKTLELKNNIYSPSKNEKEKLLSRRWKKDYEPWRKLILWGWDDDGNPSYVILYGKHKFSGVKIDINKDDIDEYQRSNFSNTQENLKPQIKEGVHEVLQEDVNYNSYYLIKGKGGHLPSFKSVKIIRKSHYNRKKRKYDYDEPALYYSKDLSYSYNWHTDGDPIEDYQNLSQKNQISFPYFKSVSYDVIVKELKDKKLSLKGFKLAENPNDILKIKEGLAKYYELIVNTMVNQRIYMRKKFMNELLSMNPPKEFIKIILDVGSPEVVSGLFLNLAKLANPILKEETKQLIESELNWAENNYAQGVKRCAKIYYNSLTPELLEERSKWIRKNHPKMDLHLKAIRGKEIPPDKIISGAAYRRYAQSYVFRDYDQTYDYDTEKYVDKEPPKRYDVGPFTDGLKLNQIEFKNTIQEAEIYGLADVIGKVAYYVDAPRLTYYLRGSGKSGALNYFQRYLRRIINSYANNDELKFMEAMKALLTSYGPDDYVCKFPGNFQFNKFLKSYLFSDFSDRPPSGWDNWYERNEFNANDQFMRLEGRYEYKKEIWDRHLDIVADIAINAQIDQVTKACYFILKESPNAEQFIGSIGYDQLIQLSIVEFEPLSEMFMVILLDKIEKLNEFKTDLMFALMGCPDPDLQNRAMDYYKRTNGKFSPQIMVDLLFLENIDQWLELFQHNLMSFTSEEYAELVRQIINKLQKILKEELVLSNEISDVLSASMIKIKDVSKVVKAEIFTVISDILFRETKFPEWLATYIEELIFTIPYEDLESTVEEMKLDSVVRAPSSRNNRIISLLKAIKYKRLPTNSEIIDVLDFGTSKMISVFLIIIDKNREKLKKRFTTLLLMFESEVTALNLYAGDVFNSLSEQEPEQKRLLSIIIDSPVQRAYSFGLDKLEEKHKEYVPTDIIVQMMEHGAPDVKAYISNKINKVIDDLGNGDKDLFMYYLKTLILLPNKHSKSKDKLYKNLPRFAHLNKDKISELEEILLEIGGSNIIIDSERALVTLAKIKMEVK